MPWCDDVWMRNAFRALKETLDVDSAMKRDMIQFLFDEGFWDQTTLRNWTSAEARFNACLNPNKSEFFKIGEIWALMKRFRRHALVAAMATDLGYELRPIPTEERRLALLDRIALSMERNELEVGEARAELTRLGETPMQPRSPALNPNARFSLAEDGAPTTAVQRIGCP